MKEEKIKYCVVTGSRAEYGLFFPLIKKIVKSPGMQLQLIVTGMHLSHEFGLSYKQIEADGFVIDEKVDILLSADSDAAITKSTGLGLIGFADVFSRLQPDWVILLGDRFETFAAAIAAHLAKIPIIHLHGGETTEGATDEAMRHAITKMANLHFTSTEFYRKRVIQLGESPERVLNVGAIGLESIRTLKLLSKKELEKQLGFKFGKLNFLVTYHPVTLEKQTSEFHIQQLLAALDRFQHATILITMPNADANGRIITQLLKQYAEKDLGRIRLFANLGQLRYLSALQYVQVVIGNSSSGIIEVPQMHIPTINIGSRQQGRVKSKTVIDSKTDTKSIIKAIDQSLSAKFTSQCKMARNPYSKTGTTESIIKRLQKVGKLTSVKKKFYDL